jgi:hypothetical protein
VVLEIAFLDPPFVERAKIIEDRTLCPSAISASTRWLPINSEPPVTEIVLMVRREEAGNRTASAGVWESRSLPGVNSTKARFRDSEVDPFFRGCPSAVEI